MKFLIFRLYGPMASWGTTAVGGVRPTETLPTRSAILGLLGAALGIQRQDQSGLEKLGRGTRLAVKAESEGRLLRDYHTVQVPASERKAVWPHRKAELENSRSINTILSTRDYRADGYWVVALSLGCKASILLDDLEAALKCPVYPLYLGRKSCPLAAPLDPRIVECKNAFEALSHTNSALAAKPGADKRLYADRIAFEWEGDDMGFPADEIFETWDQPESREKWQFSQRKVHSARTRRTR